MTHERFPDHHRHVLFLSDNRGQNRGKASRTFLSAGLVIVGMLCLLPAVCHAQPGFLFIENVGPHYNLVIDDSATTIPNPAIIPVDSGWHDIKLLNPRRGIWNYNDFNIRLHVPPGDTISIAPTFSRPFSIHSDPFDADVLLNGQFIGTTPLHIELPDTVTGQLAIQKSRYLPVLLAVDSLAGGIINIQLPPDTEAQQLFEKMFTRKKRTQQQRKTITYSLMALTLCSGFTTAYLKDRAEQRYEQYMKAGDTENMDHLYRETQRLDRYAGISLGVFEVSFTLSFYFLIKTVVN